MELVLYMLGAVMSGGIIYVISHYFLTHKESPWTYPRLHKCRCGGTPKVKWTYSPLFDYGTRESNGLKGRYQVQIKCPKCGFYVTISRRYALPSRGDNFKTIPDAGSINRANMKAIRTWNETSPEKCEECDR